MTPPSHSLAGGALRNREAGSPFNRKDNSVSYFLGMNTAGSLARVLCAIAESPYSAGIQVLSGLYSDMAAATFAVSGPRSF